MKKISYDISEVVPYINWLYFYHAWGLSGKKEEVKQKMRQEAEEMLSSWEGKYHTHALLKVLDAYSEGDDIIVETGNSDELNGCADAERSRSDCRCSGSSIHLLQELLISAWLISSALVVCRFRALKRRRKRCCSKTSQED